MFSKASPSTRGYEPTPKKHKSLILQADQAQDYHEIVQPGRVPIHEIGFLLMNRGGQRIMPLHVHDVASDVVSNGTSRRRYDVVRLVKVPDQEKDKWLCANIQKARQNSLLAPCKPADLKYACLKCTRFVGAHKLSAEGNRKYKDMVDGKALKLLPTDNEGSIIQKRGVKAVIYTAKLWWDKSAAMALVREDNANSVA